MNQMRQVQEQTRKQLLPALAWNSTVNHRRIWDAFKQTDICMTHIPHYPQGTKAIVLGSGPSLDAAMPYLPFFQGVIFASASQLSIMRHWNVHPQYVIAVDSRDSLALQLENWTDYRTILLTHPGVSPKVFDTWQGRIALFLLSFEGEWSELQSTVYSWIQAKVQPQGCVVNTTIQIAEFLGCSPIILAGVDFALIDGRNRATDYVYQGVGIDAPKPDEMRDASLHDGEMAFYHAMLLAMWKTRKTQIWQVVPHPQARLKEFPTVSLEGLNLPYPEYLSPERIDKIVDRRLKKEGMYVHPPVDGSARIEYLETDNPG
jgi:hypothetical protein